MLKVAPRFSDEERFEKIVGIVGFCKPQIFVRIIHIISTFYRIFVIFRLHVHVHGLIHFYFNPKHDVTNTIEVVLIATTQPNLNHSVAAA